MGQGSKLSNKIQKKISPHHESEERRCNRESSSDVEVLSVDDVEQKMGFNSRQLRGWSRTHLQPINDPRNGCWRTSWRSRCCNSRTKTKFVIVKRLEYLGIWLSCEAGFTPAVAISGVTNIHLERGGMEL